MTKADCDPRLDRSDASLLFVLARHSSLLGLPSLPLFNVQNPLVKATVRSSSTHQSLLTPSQQQPYRSGLDIPKSKSKLAYRAKVRLRLELVLGTFYRPTPPSSAHHLVSHSDLSNLSAHRSAQSKDPGSERLNASGHRTAPCWPCLRTDPWTAEGRGYLGRGTDTDSRVARD